MSDPFKDFVEQMARLAVPEDDTEDNRRRREAAAAELGTPISELDEFDIVASAEDEFLCSEALALWAMIRTARALAREKLNRPQRPRGSLPRRGRTRRGGWGMYPPTSFVAASGPLAQTIAATAPGRWRWRAQASALARARCG